ARFGRGRAGAGASVARGVEPELFQVLGKLAEDVPGLALATARAAEQPRQRAEHCSPRALRLLVVRQTAVLADPADELGAMNLRHSVVRAQVLSAVGGV